MLAVNILMQAVVIALGVLKHERRRFSLSGGVAAPEKCLMLIRKLHVKAHGRIPSVRDGGQRRIERLAKGGYELGKWICKVLVFTAPEAMLAHDDAAAKQRGIIVASGKRRTLIA